MTAAFLILVLAAQSAAELPDVPDAVSGDMAPATTPEMVVSLPPPPASPALPVYAVALSLRAGPTPGERVPRAWGPAAEVRWLVPAPFFVTATLAMNRFWSANDSWQFSRTGVLVLTTAGVSAIRGVGRLWAAAGIGAEAVFEHKSRQESSRLVGIEQGKGGWRSSTGPYATAEVGAGVAFWGPLAFEVAAGPSLSVHKVAGERRSFPGLTSRLGLSYVF
jgi:hypothetical protein